MPKPNMTRNLKIIKQTSFLSLRKTLLVFLPLVLMLGISILLLFLLLLLLSFYDMDKILQMKDINLSFMSIIPVVLYTDASKQKADILKDNNKKSGIYR